MIREAIELMLTPAPKVARALGYPAEQIAFAARARRRQADWRSHLEASRALTAAAVAALAGPRRRCVVLGSGALLEIDPALLSDRFEEVVFVDLCHPPFAARHWRKRGNLKFMHGDASGLAQAVVSAAQSARAAGVAPELPEGRPALRLDPERCDLVISANLLTQLAVLPTRYLTRRFGVDAYGVDALDSWADRMMRAHIDWLRAGFACPICLISDDEKETIAADGTVEERFPVLPDDLGLRAPDRSWRWDIAPKGERPDGGVQSRTVKGWIDLFAGR